MVTGIANCLGVCKSESGFSVETISVRWLFSSQSVNSAGWCEFSTTNGLCFVLNTFTLVEKNGKLRELG